MMMRISLTHSQVERGALELERGTNEEKLLTWTTVEF